MFVSVVCQFCLTLWLLTVNYLYDSNSCCKNFISNCLLLLSTTDAGSARTGRRGLACPRSTTHGCFHQNDGRRWSRKSRAKWTAGWDSRTTCCVHTWQVPSGCHQLAICSKFHLSLPRNEKSVLDELSSPLQSPDNYVCGQLIEINTGTSSHLCIHVCKSIWRRTSCSYIWLISLWLVFVIRLL